MSTWTDVSTYIKTQLKPGVLGNTNVQKILNSVLAIVNQINAGSIDPENDSLWKADVIYPADTTPVLWQDNWLVSNIAGNEGNVPINTAGVVHPTWRIIGSSVGSGIRPWQAIVYPNVLEIVFSDGFLYYLDRDIVGTDPFVSVDFAAELSAGEWKILTGGEPGEDGDDGRDPEFQVSATHVQYRLVGDTEWIDLIPLSEITGPPGSGGTPEFQVTGTMLQYRIEGDVEWIDLVDLAGLVSGIPVGGTTGQILTKNSNDDGDAGWVDRITDFTPQTGTALAFDGPNKYGFNGTALTGNLTFSITGAKETVMIKALHNSGTAPTLTPPGGVTLVKEGGAYTVSADNYLYAICHKNDAGTVTKISYSWTKHNS